MNIFNGTCGPYSNDVALLRKLGLRQWQGPIGQEQYLGDVKPYAAEETPGKETIISVYVTPMPAQGYRFEIVRAGDRTGEMEWVTIKTGTGQLTNFWPMALAVASNMLIVSEARPAFLRQIET